MLALAGEGQRRRGGEGGDQTAGRVDSFINKYLISTPWKRVAHGQNKLYFCKNESTFIRPRATRTWK